MLFPWVVAAAFLLAALAGSFFTFQGYSFAVFWPANGFLLAALLRAPAKHRWTTLGLSFLACVAANLVFGKGIPASLGMSAANLFEVAAAALLIERWIGAEKLLVEMRATFLFFGVIAPCA